MFNAVYKDHESCTNAATNITLLFLVTKHTHYTYMIKLSACFRSWLSVTVNRHSMPHSLHGNLICFYLLD